MAKQTFTTGQVLTAAQMTSLQQTAMGGGSATAKTASYVLVAADAGTTVAMNAAGSTTITVNTGLFSAGDTVFIQNWGAGTCTITAGTATVNTHGSLALGQYEGGTLYFTSASAAIFFDISQTSGMTNPMTNTGDTIYSSSGSTPARLGIGSTGQVLTVSGGVPTWATPSSGGGMTLLSTTTLSGSSTTISSISGSYINLVITIIGATTSTADALLMRFNGQTGSIYDQTKLRTTNTTVTNQSGQTSFNLGSTTATTNNNEYVICTINDYAETVYKSIQCNGIRATVGFYEVYAMANYNTAITSVTIFPVTSPYTMTGGTVKIYGVK